jgi:hypothetical protein
VLRPAWPSQYRRSREGVGVAGEIPQAPRVHAARETPMPVTDWSHAPPKPPGALQRKIAGRHAARGYSERGQEDLGMGARAEILSPYAVLALYRGGPMA